MSLSFPTMAAIRYGYGFRPGETPPQSKDALLDQVRLGSATAPAFPVGGIAGRHAGIAELQDALQQLRQDGDDDQMRREQRKVIQKKAQQAFQRDANARLMQAVLSPNGFYERLATFSVQTTGRAPQDIAAEVVQRLEKRRETHGE